jgi:hypothetical protein
VIATEEPYAAREGGIVFVAQAESKFKLLAENRMVERIIALPVPVANCVLMRAEKRQFAVRGKMNEATASSCPPCSAH